MFGVSSLATVTVEEIAAITEESVSNVGYMLHTALKTLRVRLGAAPCPADGARSEGQ